MVSNRQRSIWHCTTHFGQRQAAQFFHPGQQLSRHSGNHPLTARRTPSTLQQLYLKSANHRPNGTALGDGQIRHAPRDLFVDQPPGSVSRGDDLFQLSSRGPLWVRLSMRSIKHRWTMRLPPTITGSFQGTAQAFQSSLKSQPYLILAALVAVYIILGMLYESYIHPLTILSTLPSAGVGALLILFIFSYRSIGPWRSSALSC